MPKTKSKGPAHQRVLIFPAWTPEVSGKRVHFLFSMNQVADIVRHVPVRPVPFSPPFARGIARWRDALVPVMSLEVRLGLETKDPRVVRRRIVVRAISKEAAVGTSRLCMLDVDPSMRMLSLPIECSAANPNGWVPRKDLVRGLYEWKEGFLVVAHMGKVLSAEHEMNRSATNTPR